MAADQSGPRTKAEWRSHLRAQRSSVPAETRDREARAITETVVSLPALREGTTVCYYVPFGPEPGSLDMLDVLIDQGAHVLLPIVSPRAARWSGHATKGRSPSRPARCPDCWSRPVHGWARPASRKRTSC